MPRQVAAEGGAPAPLPAVRRRETQAEFLARMKRAEAMARAYCIVHHIDPDKYDRFAGGPAWFGCLGEVGAMLDVFDRLMAAKETA